MARKTNWEKEFDKHYDIEDVNEWTLGIVASALTHGRNGTYKDASHITNKLKKLVDEQLRRHRNKLIEFLSHDMEFKNQAQRKAAVKMYIEAFDEDKDYMK